MDQITDYCSGKRKTFNVTINPGGTEFQKKVWKELAEFPMANFVPTRRSPGPWGMKCLKGRGYGQQQKSHSPHHTVSQGNRDKRRTGWLRPRIGDEGKVDQF